MCSLDDILRIGCPKCGGEELLDIIYAYTNGYTIDKEKPVFIAFCPECETLFKGFLDVVDLVELKEVK